MMFICMFYSFDGKFRKKFNGVYEKSTNKSIFTFFLVNFASKQLLDYA